MEHRKLHGGSRDPGNPHCQPPVARPDSPLADKHHRVNTVEACFFYMFTSKSYKFTCHCSATQHLYWSSRYKAHIDVCLVIAPWLACTIETLVCLCHNDIARSAKLSMAVTCCFAPCYGSVIWLSRWSDHNMPWIESASPKASHDEC